MTQTLSRVEQTPSFWKTRPITFFEITKRIKVTSNGCWEWQGKPTFNGYGRFNNRKAHRVVYEKFAGEIPSGLVLDHLCRNRMCVNPEHLEPVTDRENIFRGQAPHIVLHLANTCKRGHVKTENNIYWSKSGSRGCKTCNLEMARIRRPGKKRLAALAKESGV